MSVQMQQQDAEQSPRSNFLVLARVVQSPVARTNLADAAVILGTLGLLYLIARIGAGALVSFHPPENVPTVSLDPVYLPYYAGRSVLRMFVALLWSTLFTFIYGYAAAHNRRAEQVLIPLLDVLQSVPVLGFLSVTVTGFIALFPGSLLGLEFASIFAIFTSQAWNMAFSFYQSLRTLPRELDEAVTLYGLPRWQRFLRLELPVSVIGLVWNAMMSFGGGWFFLAASEAISVLNQRYTLPGIGSYVAAAVGAQDFRALGMALVTMAIVIVLIDQFFWRPLIAWSDKFKLEKRASAEPPSSWLLDLFRTARLPSRLAAAMAPLTEALNERFARRFPAVASDDDVKSSSPLADRLFDAALVVIVIGLIVGGLEFVLNQVGLDEVLRAFLMGLATFGRVVVLLIFSTLVWTPVGVAIGFNPRLARVAQPVVQFLSSFPANFLFPFATLFFLWAGIDINWGGILLMALGTQWYILFNVIAGAMSVPTDLREMTTNMGLRGWRLWRDLIVPGIFGSWVTGGITAAGGAWNASIVAEIVTWGNTTLSAFGLGAYVAQATSAGDWPRIVLGVGIMSLFVVAVNRLFWRRLYALAEARFRLG
jgi:NitT/TauT family transport system permease protein